nr:speckle-type POZ protein B [Parasteatoda tepidariorum]
MADIIINFKIEIIGPSGRILYACENKNVTFSRVDGSDGGKAVERSRIVQDILEMNKDTLSIRCYMSRVESIDDSSLNCFTRTKIIVNHQSLRLRWTILNELKTLFEPDEENRDITTEFVQFPDMNKYKLCFVNSNDGVVIRIIGHCVSSQCVECKISLLDVNGCQVLSIKDRYQFSEDDDDDDSWILPTFLTFNNLKVNRSKFIKNGSMCILCELFCFGGIESQAVFYGNREIKLLANHSDNAITNHSLQSDIRNLFSDKNFCDIKIRGNDGIVEAHKSILIARSPVFHAMFQQEMLETQTGIVDIPDADIDTLNFFVNFLYSDTLEKIDYDRLKKLLILADKYEVRRLIEICASFLRCDISERNACDIASLANMFNHTDLKSFALDFIVDHHTDIFNQPDWLPWTRYNMELATEFLIKYAVTLCRGPTLDQS